MKTKYITAHYAALVSNIRLNYYAAKQYPVLFKSGLNWYKNSNQVIQEMADRHRIPFSVVCGVVAALSPGNKWERNLVDAEVAIAVVLQGGSYEDFKTASYPQNKN